MERGELAMFVHSSVSSKGQRAGIRPDEIKHDVLWFPARDGDLRDAARRHSAAWPESALPRPENRRLIPDFDFARMHGVAPIVLQATYSDEVLTAGHMKENRCLT